MPGSLLPMTSGEQEYGPGRESHGEGGVIELVISSCNWWLDSEGSAQEKS